MKRLILAAAVALPCAYATPAQAYWMDGNGLYDVCLETKKLDEDKTASLYKAGHCMGYLQGFLDGNPVICVPVGATIGQIRRIVLRYLSENTDILHFEAKLLVFTAIFNAWPDCIRE